MYKVLVVDDESIVRHGIVMETNWSDIDCLVVGEAANGIEGLEAVKKYDPDIIICDIKMPGMDGIEMLNSLRQDGCKAAVVYLSAYNEFSYVQKALRLGAADYLLKPFEDGELEKTVGDLIKRMENGEEKQDHENRDESTPILTLKSGDKSKYVMAALEYITENYTKQDISVGMIAESLGLSEGHLSHVFKKETDYTVNAYITRYRMRAAMKLLKNCRYKVYEVADMVGYKDINYFSSIFKKLIGVTPSEYQNRSI